jgi:signal transduction histidine kinase/CHASE2 domain-containing sensor protein
MSSFGPNSETDNSLLIWRWARLTLALLVLTVLCGSTFPVMNFDQKLGDLYFRMRGAQPTSNAVALVLIDDAALAGYGRWPWPRHGLARLVRAIASFQPKAIGIDILLPEPEDKSNDADLAQAIGSAHNVVLASKISGSLVGSLWVDPLPVFSRNATAIGHVQATVDADGVCRRIPIVEPSVEGSRFAFALKLAEIARPELMRRETGGQIRDSKEPIEKLERIVPRNLTINYRHQLTSAHAAPPFVAVPASDLLEGKEGGAQLRDKVVLLGFGATELSDRLFTPVSNQIPMPGVEVNANVVDTLISGTEVQECGITVQVLLLAGFSMLLLWIVVRWPGLGGLILLAATLLAAFAGGYFLFVRFHILFRYGPLLVAGVMAAPLAQLENLILVDRAITRRLRDLQQFLNPARSNLALNRVFGVGAGPSRSDLHWKLNTLRRLQAELVSLYTFDETLIGTMEEPLAVFTVDGRLIFQNASWRKFCKTQDIEEVISLRAFTDLMGGWQELARGTAEPSLWVQKDSSLKRGLWRVRATRLPQISQAESGAVMLLLEDISAAHERDLARAEALSFVTHELRTPLIAIQGFAEFLIRYPDKSTTSEAPATIFRESRRLVAMINAYLEVLRLDAGSRPLRLKAIDIAGLMKHVDQILQPLAQAARIRLRIDNQLGVPFVECDEPLVSGALLNLLSNAIKYSPAESEVVLRALSNQNTIEFAVHNPGPAIPSEELDRLFEPFYRASQHADTKPGWGLGLAFVKRISEQHGGRIEVSSDEASGTCFRLTLPIGSGVACEALL